MTDREKSQDGETSAAGRSAKKALMPRWLLWTLLAVISWGIWAILARLIGDALSAVHSQALSTLGLLPVIAVLAGMLRRRGVPLSPAHVPVTLPAPVPPVPVTKEISRLTDPPLGPGLGEILDSLDSRVPVTRALDRPAEDKVPVTGGGGGSSADAENRSRRAGATWAFAAGVLTCLGNAAYYDVLNRGGSKAANVVPLTALYPLVTVFLAVLFLQEKLNRIQWLGVITALASIYLLNVTGEQGIVSPWLLYALVPIGVWGVAGLMQKISTQYCSGEFAALYFLGAFIPVALIILWREPLAGPLAARTWWLVIGLGLFFALGNLALLNAFASHGQVSVIGPLAGLYPVVSLPIAILGLGERIGARETVGIVLALMSVAALAMETTSATPTAAQRTGKLE